MWSCKVIPTAGLCTWGTSVCTCCFQNRRHFLNSYLRVSKHGYHFCSVYFLITFGGCALNCVKEVRKAAISFGCSVVDGLVASILPSLCTDHLIIDQMYHAWGSWNCINNTPRDFLQPEKSKGDFFISWKSMTKVVWIKISQLTEEKSLETCWFFHYLEISHLVSKITDIKNMDSHYNRRTHKKEKGGEQTML